MAFIIESIYNKHIEIYSNVINRTKTNADQLFNFFEIIEIFISQHEKYGMTETLNLVPHR